MSIPDTVLELVHRFTDNRDAYHRGAYNETQLRREFLDPFFETLGWDVSNRQGHAEAYKDVIHEDAVKVGGATKAPDYSFRIGGTRKFFVEAKKPSVDVKGDPGPAFQLRRYAWSAKLPLSIVTDFEEFAVYDCRLRPSPGDKASAGRLSYCGFEEYANRWEEIAGVFSRDAVLKGSFDKYAESKKGKRGTAEVDGAFLEEIEGWRDLLARHIALRNPKLSVRELNFSVQRIIDRIVFLRICEDRGIEDYGRLQALGNGANAYERLVELFHHADDRYNSGIFGFREEKGRQEPPDSLTPRLHVDDEPLKQIVRGLYYPDSPYEFSVLPADILGQVYERFLGKVIRLTQAHRAVVEEKPEVKKAGGVFYTPKLVVDYIVEKTIGKLLDGATPTTAARLKILDPACGSGSFLIAAYQRLLDWHRDWYVTNGSQRHKKVLYQGRAGEWRLTTAERKRILLNNIFGVDIDPQAVEVTKLSLLLKVLEGESQESLQKQFWLLHERALPDLGANVKCGNSLVGMDRVTDGQLDLLSDEARYGLNPFDWHAAFPAILSRGGFDAVIGNPPYVRIQTLREYAPEQAEYVRARYVSASKGSFDLYVAFIEKGVQLLGSSGRLGYIVPSKFLTTDYGAAIRSFISDSRTLELLADFGHSQVFTNASTYSCILVLTKAAHSQARYVRADTLVQTSGWPIVQEVELDTLGEEPWILGESWLRFLMTKLRSSGTPLIDLPTRISRGSSTGADEVFCLVGTKTHLRTRDGEAVDIEPDLLRKPVYAGDLARYSLVIENNEQLLFPYEVSAEAYRLVPEDLMRRRYPKAYEYLRARRHLLAARKQHGPWYGFSAPRDLSTRARADIVVPLLADRGTYAPIPGRLRKDLCLMASGGFTITLPRDVSPDETLFTLGLLNSRLLFWFLQQISNRFRGGWITCTKQYVGQVPIVRSAPESARRRLTKIAGELVSLYMREKAARTPEEQSSHGRSAQALELAADDEVFALYGLTDGEIQALGPRTSSAH